MRRRRSAAKQNAHSGNTNNDPSVFHTDLFRGPGLPGFSKPRSRLLFEDWKVQYSPNPSR
jgi:hypothetical protein